MTKARIDELTEALGTWTPDSGTATPWVLPELRELLDAEFVGTYRPVLRDAGWKLAFMHGVGRRAEQHVETFSRYVESLPATETFLGYRPDAVPPAQRNRAISIERVTPAQDVLRGPLFQALDLVGHDQVRALLCDGPALMSWVGATRREPFTPAHRALLNRIAKPLQKRVLLEQRMASVVVRARAFDAAIEALEAPAFLIGPQYSIDVANRSGRMLLERNRGAVLDAIRRGATVPSSDAEFSVTRLRAPGCPEFLLAVRRERQPNMADHVSCAQRAWRLTTRQSRVLELVASGHTTKQIAHELECAEVTVENHLTEIFRRSGARSRVELVVRLFRLRPGALTP